MKWFIVSIRLTVVTMLIAVGAYTLLTLGIARVIAPATSEGSLIFNADNQIVGSYLIAQKFTQPQYFWPRPSAADYNASAAAGSNKSPTSRALYERGTQIVAAYGASAENPVPAELASASGAGLDPHISLSGALYQAPRVALARGLNVSDLEVLITQNSIAQNALMEQQLVNVLELNLALDAMRMPQ